MYLSYRLRSHARQAQQAPGAVGQQRVARGRETDIW